MRRGPKPSRVVGAMLAFALLLGVEGWAFAGPASEARVAVLISFRQSPGPAETALIHEAGGRVKRSYHRAPVLAASVPESKIDLLRRSSGVAFVEADITVEATEILPWGVDRIDAEVVHDENKGRGVKVAILDTGIDLGHPDLQVRGGVSFVEGTDSGDDDHGHGTMVAGVVAALDNDIGVVGVAPEAELYSVKVLNKDGWGYSSDILSGIEWAIDQGMQVVNMSFGSFLELPVAVQTALEEAYQQGIVLVAAAGNVGDQDVIFSPARYDPVIAVGATEQQDARADFSSTGSTLELMAPGVDILTTGLGGGYSSGSGTSLASPHVAGAVALLLALGVTNNVELRHILQGTAVDRGAPGWDSWYGFGLVNAAEAVEAAQLAISNLGGDDSQLTDRMAPITRIELNGLQGDNSWYRSEVRVELTATDNLGGSGIVETQYSLDGMAWESYRGPFLIVQEGVNFILARSRDYAGNLEWPPERRGVSIDRTVPTVNLSVTPEFLWPVNHRQVMAEVWVNGAASDALSGLSSVQLAVRDEYGQVEPFIGGLPSRILLEAWREGSDLDGRAYTIRITATDSAGNWATAEATVTVTHDRRRREEN